MEVTYILQYPHIPISLEHIFVSHGFFCEEDKHRFVGQLLVDLQQKNYFQVWKEDNLKDVSAHSNEAQMLLQHLENQYMNLESKTQLAAIQGRLEFFVAHDFF